MRYWLLKTEPESYSIQDLAKEKKQSTFWNGVRNYQARNLLRDEFQVDDLALLYHSNANPPGVVGICKITQTGLPDPSAFDKKSKYYDEDSTRESPRWFGVQVELVEQFPTLLPLDELKLNKNLEGIELLRRGSRLSVQPVSKKHFDTIRKMARN